jgi:chromosome segregation ATPase
MNKKPTYCELEQLNKKLTKEISKLAIQNVELEKEKAKLEVRNRQVHLSLDDKTDKLGYSELVISNLNNQTRIALEEKNKFKRERAELTVALVEIINCTEEELTQKIAKEAIKHIHSTIKLEPNHPF